MAGYIHGNLAVERKQPKVTRVKEQTRIVVRKKISTQERLLLMFAIAVGVLVAGAIILRYAQIYEMNLQLQKVEKDIKVLQTENSKMRLKLEAMMNPKELEQRAKAQGFVEGTDKSEELIMPETKASSEVAITE
ncbi:cell division protein FtsL [Paenibacillus gansuensis]|uniref:Cell division protein FtsL n=1 Tax=Paenibacillus gansuensis TaxID=306542 RepID=A0ABW5PD08_9BACL